MSTTTLSMYQLLESIMDRGLPFVASYLEKKVKKPVVITDNIGYVHYPETKGESHTLDEMFIDVPTEIKDDEHLYLEEEGKLYYAVGNNEARAYIILENLPAAKLEDILTLIHEAKLAIKNYFTNLVKIRNSTEKFEKKFAEDLFFKSHSNIRDIIKLSEKDLDIDKPYFIKIAQVDKNDQNFDLRLIRSYSIEYCKKVNLDIIPVAWGDSILFIIPALFKEDTLEVDPEWPRLADSVKWKEDLDKRFNCEISCGLGECYTLRDLHKSYNEARIALTLPKLIGQKGFVQKFSDLGVFSLVFSHDVDVLKKYCQKTLGSLSSDTELLQTLRTMLDNAFNWKITADQLFIHVNTLHYRISKIEKLLDVDLSKMDARVNMYVALKVWDSLKQNGYLNLV